MAADQAPGVSLDRGSAAGSPGPADFPVVVKRSARRRRTVSARFDAGTLIISIPAWFDAGQEREWVEKMRARMVRRGTGPRSSDAALARRAAELSRAYLPGRTKPMSVRWVDNQRTRWGSATPAHGTIRISRAVAGMPSYVQDYVLLHELAHLIVPGHGPRFWRLLDDYPLLDRAQGYLEGYAAARGLPAADENEERAEDPEEVVSASVVPECVIR